MPPSTTTKRIQVVVNAGDSKAQLKIVADGMAQVNKETKKMASDLGLLSGAFQTFIGYLGVRQLAQFSDEMQNLTNRLKILTGSQGEAESTLKSLLQLSDSLNTSVAELGETYTRLGTALKNTNISTDALLQLTEVLQNSFRISGSTTNETTATIIQLSQAFASGTLRGQELRSVMLQNATLAGLLRERFGKNLAKDAEAGLISISAVMEVLLKHQDAINESAKKLTPTFEQTLTKAIGHLKYEIGELNKKYEFSALFADAMAAVVNNLGIIILAVATIAIPALTLALTRLALANPITAVLTVGLAGLVYLINQMGDASDTFTQKLLKLQAKFYDFIATLIELRVRFREAALGAAGFFDISGKYKNDTDLLSGLVIDYKNAAAALRHNAVEIKGPEREQTALEKYIATLKASEAAAGKLAKVKDVLAELNQEFLKGEITVEEYGKRIVDFDLYKLNRSFAEGKINLDAYNKAWEELERRDINRALNEGAISLQQFNQQIEASKTRDLNAQLQAGTISLQEFRAEMVLISEEMSAGGLFAAGTQSYLDSMGTTSKQIAEAISGAWKGLETEFNSFIKTGKFNFASFTKDILDELQKIAVRAYILKPLAQGLEGLFNGSGSATYNGPRVGNTPYITSSVNALGNAFPGGIRPFATGGVFNTPTMFKYGGGKTGIMGEAGPEAILPLSRGSGGTLGVQATVTPVTINIVNNTPAEVESRETTGPNGDRQIEVLINNKVKEGIASGTYDKNFQQAYGLKRRGS